jgi:hypothetical protein
MSTADVPRTGGSARPESVGGEYSTYEESSGYGWVLFAGTMLLMLSVLNGIDGIAAVSNSTFFVNDAKFILSNLNTWGWIAVGIGLIQVIAAGSLWRGGLFGRIFGIGAASLSAIGALLSIPAYPFWSLAIFALDIVIIHQIAAHGTQGRGADAETTRGSDAMSGMAQYRQ